MKPTDRQSTPTLREFIERKLNARLEGLRVALPARVTGYDASRQCVDAQPLVDQAIIDEAGDRRSETLPVIAEVPIVWPGSGPCRITFPIAAGDIVLLVFASSSIARWKVTGKAGDPGDDWHHQLTDAIAIPGLVSLVDHPTEAPNDALVVHSDGIKLGGAGAMHAIARVPDVEAAVKGALSDPTIAGAILGISAPGGAAALEAAVAAYFVANPVSGSAKVKSE